ncbi:MAG: hypothetical protein U9Q70_11555 [Chloroflexota bacterium]|nr:hypothetical protein [Chloroflexota bacterium]
MKKTTLLRGKGRSALTALLPLVILLTACGRGIHPTVEVPTAPEATPVPSRTFAPTLTAPEATAIVSLRTPDVPNRWPTQTPSPTVTLVPREKSVIPTPGALSYTAVLTIESPIKRPLTVVLDNGRLFITGNRNPGEYFGEILMYDLDTGELTSVASSTYGPQGCMTDIDVSGEWLVWQTHSGWGTDWILYAKNLATGEEILVDSAEQAGATSPRGAYVAVSGDTLVWATIRKVGDGPIQSNVMAYDLTRHQTHVIASARMPDNVGNVDIDGERVVWGRGSTAGGVKQANVFMYNLATQAYTQLSYDGRSGQPRIQGDYVAWRQGFGDMGPIVIYNWKTDEGIKLSRPSEWGEFPRLGDGLVCWERYTGDVRSVLYNMERNIVDGFIPSSREGQDTFYDGWPSLWRRKVALSYKDKRTGQWYIEVREY